MEEICERMRSNQIRKRILFRDANLVRFGVGFAETAGIIADPVSGSIFFEDV